MTDTQAAKRRCTRFLSYRYPKTARRELLDLADAVDPEAGADKYGTGELIEPLEARIAALLGKPAAVFMPSGTAAQLIALRLWCGRSGSLTIAIHPRSHIAESEQGAYQFLHGMRSVPFGPISRQASLADAEALAGPIGAAVVELPLRRLGWPLPDWDALTAMADNFRDRNIPFHADAARIWELQPYYGKPFDVIAGLFDSLYVSFYKGLDAPAGAAIAGPADLIDDARLWQWRAGARLNALYPYVIGATRGLDEKLPLMPAYFEKARAIAEALRALPGIRVNPDPPQSNSFQIVIDGDPAKLDAARLAVAEETGIWPFEKSVPVPVPGVAVVEAVILDAAFDLSEAEITDCVALLAAGIGTAN